MAVRYIIIVVTMVFFSYTVVATVLARGSMIACSIIRFLAAAVSKLTWMGDHSSGRQTTSVFHQATQANSASYSQWDEK